MSSPVTNRVSRPVRVTLVCILVFFPVVVQAQEQPTTDESPAVFHACYVPTTGLMYRIKESGLQQACLTDTHVEFSWRVGDALLNDSGDGPVGHVVIPDEDGFAVTGTLNAGTIPVQGAGVRMMFYPRKAAFRVGQVLAGHWNDGNIGVFSTATGFNTTAKAAFATATGRVTSASGSAATAMGYKSVASGEAATAAGRETSANGDHSVAMGFDAVANGEASLAIGRQTRADVSYGIALGYDTRAGGIPPPGAAAMAQRLFNERLARDHSGMLLRGLDRDAIMRSLALQSPTGGATTSIAIGTESWTPGGGIVIGAQATSTFGLSTAIGFGTASSLEGTAIGTGAYAGLQGTALGYNVHAGGDYSTAVGYGAVAAQDGDLALGGGSMAKGWYSTAINGGIATGIGSTAIGGGALANGRYSTAIGAVTAQAASSVVLGQYNVVAGDDFSWIETDPLLVVGNGSDNANRSNALTLLKNGDLTIGGTFAQASDARMKDDVQDLDGVLSKLDQVRGVRFRFADESNGSAGPHVGLLAQEVQQAFPELVREDSRGHLSVAYGNFTAVLLEAIKEQQAKIAQLEAALMRLEAALSSSR